jgi:hypothetical protein
MFNSIQICKLKWIELNLMLFSFGFDMGIIFIDIWIELN